MQGICGILKLRLRELKVYKIKSFFRRLFAMHKKWYKRWWIWLIAIFIVCMFISIPFIINESYKLGKGYVTLWDASDMLSFYGSTLSFLGSIVLGIVALVQNEKIRKFSLKVFDMEHRYEKVPMFTLKKIEFQANTFFQENYENVQIAEKNNVWTTTVITHNESDPEAELYFDISLENVGEGLAKNIEIQCYDELGIEMVDRFEPIVKLNEECKFLYRLPMFVGNRINGENDFYHIDIFYESVYGFKSGQTICVECEKIKGYEAKFTISLKNY